MSTEDTNKDNKPCACETAPAGQKSSRRDFLLFAGFGLNAVAGAMIGIPVVGYLMSAFVQKYPLYWISLGAVDSFPEGATRLAEYKQPHASEWDGETAKIPCWVRRIEGDKFQVFAINCTHLGCPVRWFAESKLFMCPCHGGAYYEDGGHAAGPPPRGLFEYPFKVENNQLMVNVGVMPSLANTIP